MKRPVRVALIGAKGRMGQTIVDLAKADPKIDIVAQSDLGDSIEAALNDCDVAIDFSNASSIEEVCRAASQNKTEQQGIRRNSDSSSRRLGNLCRSSLLRTSALE